MVQLSATRRRYIAILWISLVGFVSITLLCCFSTSNTKGKRTFRYRLSPETFGYTFVLIHIGKTGARWYSDHITRYLLFTFTVLVAVEVLLVYAHACCFADFSQNIGELHRIFAFCQCHYTFLSMVNKW